MTISSRNFLARYYEWIFGELPNDLCSFFWGSLLIIVTAPLLVVGRLTVGRDEDAGPFTMIFIGLIIWMLSWGMISLGNTAIGWFGYEFTHWTSIIFLAFFLGVAVLVSIVGSIVGAGYLVIKKAPRVSIVQNTKDFVGAIRGKYCTKINWK